MAEMTRRAWLTMLGVAPVMGGLAAWAKHESEEPEVPTRERLSPRERFQRIHLPNVELITHEGKKVHFYDDLVKDKKVAINLIQASCPDLCPLITANLVQVKKRLADRVGRDIFFYSVTIEPEKDTPEVLKEYAEKFGVGPGWLFLTGKPKDIERLRRSLSSYVDPAEDAILENHTGMLRLGTEPLMFWGSAPAMANPEHILRILLWEFDRPLPGEDGRMVLAKDRPRQRER
jgi:protein SCO1/2